MPRRPSLPRRRHLPPPLLTFHHPTTASLARKAKGRHLPPPSCFPPFAAVLLVCQAPIFCWTRGSSTATRGLDERRNRRGEGPAVDPGFPDLHVGGLGGRGGASPAAAEARWRGEHPHRDRQPCRVRPACACVGPRSPLIRCRMGLPHPLSRLLYLPRGCHHAEVRPLPSGASTSHVTVRVSLKRDTWQRQRSGVTATYAVRTRRTPRALLQRRKHGHGADEMKLDDLMELNNRHGHGEDLMQRRLFIRCGALAGGNQDWSPSLLRRS